MHKGYTYIDGKVIISDENGNHTHSEYYDNLNQVLVTENLIEEIEKKIENYTKESQKYPQSKKKYIPVFFLIMIVGIIAIPPLVVWGLSGVNPYSVTINTTFGMVKFVNLITLISGSIGLPVASLTTFFDYSNYRENVKKADAINSKLFFLKKRLIKEKNTLARLKKEKTRIHEKTDIHSNQVDDKQQLESLKNDLELFSELGSHLDKYYHYYLQGKLEYKMHDDFNDNEIEQAKEFFEEEGFSLVKKKKTN